jgi:hypothetical protein
MSLTKGLVAIASIAVCAASLSCYAQGVPASSVQLSIPAKYSYRAMIATFTPPNGLTLSEYAGELGYIGFNWQQTITNWPNMNLKTSDGVYVVPVPPDPPFLDPPLGGYSYSPCGPKHPSPAAAAANPFYFDPTGSSTDCFSLAFNEKSAVNPTTLSFGDEPMDPKWKSPEIPPQFMTALVGITADGIPSSPLFYWTWETTYNGSVGSANSEIATSANNPDLDPGYGGTGRATITSINGVPVPEPPGLLPLIPGTLAILAAHWGVRRRRTAPKMIRP